VADGCAAAANLSATVRSRREDRDDRSLGCGEGEERCSSRRIAAAHGGAAGDFGAVEEERFGESKVTGEAACENNSPLPRAFFIFSLCRLLACDAVGKGLLFFFSKNYFF
jgi:hypothetical protein